MSIIVHIWTGEMPKMAMLNAIYGGNVGHASITIVDLQNERKPIYISHRPKVPRIDPRIDIINVSEVEKDESKKYVLKGYAPKAEPISFKKDCDLRKRKPDIEMYMSSSYLNISRMILYSEKYLQNELPEPECLYHIGKNNCCSVVVNIIRQGLNCPSIKKTCGICKKGSNQIGTSNMFWLLRIVGTFFCIIGFLISLMIVFSNLQFDDFPYIVSFLFPMLFILGGLIWFTNIERSVIALMPTWNIWSPITLQVFVKRINKIIEKKKYKFRC
ncbi:MAG: hypothetical protein F6K56_29955, partial [Moorea sp. SIO3G5]|nr:hypothetical protein [Moorena sp. SIO3G5]